MRKKIVSYNVHTRAEIELMRRMHVQLRRHKNMQNNMKRSYNVDKSSEIELMCWLHVQL